MSVTGIPFPKIEAVSFRELRPEETAKLMPFLRDRGWGVPYPFLSAAIVGEYQGEIISFGIMQIIPQAGPLWVAEDWRGTGVAEMTAQTLQEYMTTRAASGPYISIAQNPFSERLCRTLGMKEMPGKVFIKE